PSTICQEPNSSGFKNTFSQSCSNISLKSNPIRRSLLPPAAEELRYPPLYLPQPAPPGWLHSNPPYDLPHRDQCHTPWQVLLILPVSCSQGILPEYFFQQLMPFLHGFALLNRYLTPFYLQKLQYPEQPVHSPVLQAG